MTTFTDLVRYLEAVPGESVTDAAAELLVQGEDWCGLVADYIRALPEKELCRLVLLGSRVPGVMPKPFLLYEGPGGRFQIVLNHFDRQAFDSLLKACRINPHHHSFPFTTRILHGWYYQWLYANDGSLETPQLRLAAQTKCEVGDVCTLPYDIFHLVLAPHPDTLTLLVRGPAVFDPGHPQDPSYTVPAILEARTMLLRLLGQAPGPQPGRVVPVEKWVAAM